MLCDFTIDNWLTLISLLFIVVGGLFAYAQWRKDQRIKRAEFIRPILEKLRFDEELSKTMYMVEYGEDWYDLSFHSNGKLESSIDKLFSNLDYICYLKLTDNITKTEFKVFRYEIHRVCISYSSKVYLWNLHHFARKNKTDCSFQFLVDYGIKSKFFPKDFKKNTSLYNKTLNW